MIFGKSYDEIREEAIEKRIKLRKWQDDFAFLPIRLSSGRFVWLETVQYRKLYSGEIEYRVKP